MAEVTIPRNSARSACATATFRSVLYCATVISSFVIFCPIAISQGVFGPMDNTILEELFTDYRLTRYEEQCLLYMNVRLKSPGLHSICAYNIATAVIVCFLWPAVGISVIILIVCGKIKAELTHQVPCMIFAVTDGIAFILELVSACTITVGLKTLCDSITTEIPCSSLSVFHYRDPNDKFFFYAMLKPPQVGAWIATILWLIQFIWSLIMVVLTKRRQRQQRNTDFAVVEARFL